MESMLSFFFYYKSVVHKKFIPPGLPVNAAFYMKVLKWLKKRAACVPPEIANTWVLHHDNVPSHASLLVREFLAKPWQH
jgi:hypothetical protein